VADVTGWGLTAPVEEFVRSAHKDDKRTNSMRTLQNRGDNVDQTHSENPTAVVILAGCDWRNFYLSGAEMAE
jgi:hypothetical protein